jgi:hypothetical protein
MTHCKKYINVNYISGEDLKDGLNGLKNESPIVVSSFAEEEVFDQQTRRKGLKHVLYFAYLDGIKLAKGVVVGNPTIKYFSKAADSMEIEKWIGQTAIIHAVSTTKCGWVVRFKKYEKTVLEEGTSNWTAWINFVKGGGDPAKVRDGLQVSDELFKKLEDARPKK